MIGPLLPGKSEAWCYWCKLTSTCAASYLPDLGGSLSCDGRQATSNVQKTAWSKRGSSAFSSGSDRDADVPSVDGVHVHCLDKLKCSVYFNFIDSVDKLAKVIKIHCILLVWERFDGSAFIELILALYPLIWCGCPKTPKIRREPELLWILE